MDETGIEGIARTSRIDHVHGWGRHVQHLTLRRKPSASGAILQDHMWKMLRELCKSLLRIGQPCNRFRLFPVRQEKIHAAAGGKQIFIVDETGIPAWIKRHRKSVLTRQSNQVGNLVQGLILGDVQMAGMRPCDRGLQRRRPRRPRPLCEECPIFSDNRYRRELRSGLKRTFDKAQIDARRLDLGACLG